MKTICFQGVIDGAWSLGRVGRRVLTHLMNRRDYQAYFYPVDKYYTPEQWSAKIRKIITRTPWELDLDRSFQFCSVLRARQKRVARLMTAWHFYEFSTLPAKIAEDINSSDHFYVTSSFVMRVFSEHGVTVPMTVVGHGFDPKYYQYKPRVPGEEFVFLCVAEHTTRKNLPMLIRCFEAAFHHNENVRLVLKLGLHGVGDLRAHISQPGKVKLHTRQLADESKLAALYQNAHCFVLPTRAEGFGMPMLEAMATGLPVIVTNYSGHLDFCVAETSFLVSSKGLVDCDAESFPYIKSQWAEPDEEHLVELMRHVYNNYDHAQVVARRAAETVHQHWTWEAQLVHLFP